MEDEFSMLVVVFDTSTTQKYIKTDPKAFYRTVEALIAFCNAHLMLHTKNQVAFLISNMTQSEILYPLEFTQPEQQQKLNNMIRQNDGQYEAFIELERVVKKRMRGFITGDNFYTKDTTETSSRLASSLSRALCFINRKEKDLAPGEKMNSRILVVSGSSESSAQYMSFMNVFFTAQKLGVAIDACVLETYATLLNQGADISGGIYFRVDNVKGLLEYLLWIFLPDVFMRKGLNLPPPVPVDYRAACFCDRQFISSGFVCSVCLSIFCKYTPICTTCNAVFKRPVYQVARSKTKR